MCQIVVQGGQGTPKPSEKLRVEVRRCTPSVHQTQVGYLLEKGYFLLVENLVGTYNLEEYSEKPSKWFLDRTPRECACG